MLIHQNTLLNSFDFGCHRNLMWDKYYEKLKLVSVYEDEITGEQEEESDDDLPDGSQR